MKNLGWLVLLLSLGVNIGLGYRLLVSPADDSRPGDAIRTHHDPDCRPSGQWDRDAADRMRFSRGDSSTWCRIMDRRLERIAGRLDLTSEQMEVFRSTQRENAAVLLQQRRRIGLIRDHLRGIVARQTVDPDSVRAIMRDLGGQQARLDSLVTETMLKEMAVLEPGQRTLYLKILPFFRDHVPGRPSGRSPHFRRH